MSVNKIIKKAAITNFVSMQAFSRFMRRGLQKIIQRVCFVSQRVEFVRNQLVVSCVNFMEIVEKGNVVRKYYSTQ